MDNRSVILGGMELREYMAKVPTSEREAFAIACGTTVNYLNMVRCGAKRASPELAIAIEKATSGKVRCEEMRPDVDWAFLRASKCCDKAKAA